MASLKAYGKVNEADQEKLDARRKSRKRIAIISLSSIILVVVVVSAVVGTSLNKDGKNSGGGGSQSPSASIKAVCDGTLFSESCRSSLGPLVTSKLIQPQDLHKLSVQVAMDELSRVSHYFSENGGLTNVITEKMGVEALQNCRELLGLALDHLNSSLSMSGVTVFEAIDDVVTWLSSAGTYQQTCIDGFDNALSTSVSQHLKNSTEFTSNSLAIIEQFSNIAKSLQRRRLLSLPGAQEMPSWISMKDRRLLQVKNTAIKADAVVATDGSGKYKKIGDALKAVPDKSKKRFVIYVKKGVYFENIRVEKTKWNVMMVGEGMDATIVSGSLNFVDGTPTFSSATFAVFGQGFIARDLGIRNTAGPSKHQAVAIMSTADQSVFYRCRFDAFQDTLYAHSNRQFYRECNIYGTVDFIFGNSAVVIQNCNILPKKPMLGQQNTITAQGKFDPNQKTGISIQNCTIWPAGNLTSVQTFLGRPWKNHSTTVYMNTMMGSLIDPKGWLPWVGNTAPDTIFYAEFQNFGPGSSTKNRVKWKGLKFITSKIASKFTVSPFIGGDKWIKAAGVSYKSGL
ncbi:hypothetical protein RJ639_010675 [Escallonia herrerae]|uniref:Pectinesterase n=1 Tax=Escallonia herrerae TaxID=1293975 RepID=A0AA88VP06_9ASTE|nr:hypothetical protein RJ639_010675 [Escallonia herrerae]